MRRVILTGLALIMLFVAGGCRQPAEKAAKKEVDSADGLIIAVGDSLTAGAGVDEQASYPALLQKRLQAAGLHYRVINAGVSGETSSGTLSRLGWILTQKPGIVILETGANDGLRGIDPELTRANIEKIMARLQAEKIVTVLAGMRMVGNMGGDYTESFRKLYEDVARESGAVFMPFFLEGVAGDPAFNNSDGIHPNARGYEIITDNLFPYVVQAINKRREADEDQKGGASSHLGRALQLFCLFPEHPYSTYRVSYK